MLEVADTIWMDGHVGRTVRRSGEIPSLVSIAKSTQMNGFGGYSSDQEGTPAGYRHAAESITSSGFVAIGAGGRVIEPGCNIINGFLDVRRAVGVMGGGMFGVCHD
jgi:hypothetical protein